MSMINPPPDMSASEKRTFRKLVATLAEAGVDVPARGDLIMEYVRVGSRLTALREAEMEAEPARRFQAARAFNAAAIERRRLHTAIWQGVKARGQERKLTVAELAEKIATDEGSERWRRYFHHGDRSLSHDELTERYGRPDWGPLLYETPREQARCELYLEACAGRLHLPLLENLEDDEIADL